ncbi:MAG: proprotein convertase P-domain-containing protein [Deltaproteobacteria bacterium]|nr:proprotein convertase P-domain-containing protein [Deltaproteobacteria bacterium]
MKMNKMAAGFLLSSVALMGLVACGEASVDSGDEISITKDEAAKYAKADGFFVCPDEWMGDGFCDWYCIQLDPDCAPPRPTDHRPFCDMAGIEGAGWYWGDSGDLILLDGCEGMEEPRCDNISSRSEGWFSDGGLIVWDHECHQTERISLWGEPCGGSIGYFCYENRDLWCQGLPDPDAGIRGGSGICRDFGYCEEAADCGETGNVWIHPMCTGYASCGANRCVWHCDGSPAGPWSWTTVLLADFESEHPYTENMEQQWTVRKQGAAKIKIRFMRIETEEEYDWITVTSDAEESALYLDGVLDDTWTPELEADNLTITLTTDYSINAWGFRADLVSYYEQLPFGMCNRNEDCGTGRDCIPNFCENHYAPCYGECRHDDHCDDGTELMCDVVPPQCPNRTILAYRNHCYVCVHPEGCIPIDGDEDGETYTCIQKVDIPDADPVGIESDLLVEGLPVDCMLDATLDLAIGHSYAGDLLVGLTNPAGMRTILWNREGGGQQNVSLSGFELTAEQSLSLAEAQGTWTLDVSDHASLDTGTLETWSLHFSCH